MLPSVARRTFQVPGASAVFVIVNEATSALGAKFLLVSLLCDHPPLTLLRRWSEIEAEGSEKGIMTTLQGELWIGLVELSGPSSNPILQGGAGAYSTYLMIGRSFADFRTAAAKSALELDLVVNEVEWAEPYEKRLERYGVEEYLCDLAEQVRESGEGVFGHFHTWEPDA